MITVWMPMEMTGTQCRKWLERNIPLEDRRRPGERDRIQKIVDCRLGRVQMVSIGENKSVDSPASERTDPRLWRLEYGVCMEELACIIADEVIRRIGEQRVAIRRMEPFRLRSMIFDIFEAVANDCYVEKKIADTYKLGKSTFSRFAGGRCLCRLRRLRQKKRKIPKARMPKYIPDLWKILADVINRNLVLQDAARDVGVIEGVVSLLEDSKQGTEAAG